MEALERWAGGLLIGTTLEARLLELGKIGRAGCDLIGEVAAHALTKPYVIGLDRLIDLARSPEIE